MTRVAGGDEFTGIELRMLNAWGTASGADAYERLPVISDDFANRHDGVEEDPTIGTSGAKTTYDSGRFISGGTIVVPAYYNHPMLWKLICGAMGGMERYVDAQAINNAPITGGDFSGSHIYVPQDFNNALDEGSNAARSGPWFGTYHQLGGSVSSGGHGKERLGVAVAGFTFDQPENGYPTWSFDMIAQKSANTAERTLATKPTGLIRMLGSEVRAPQSFTSTLVGSATWTTASGSYIFNFASFQFVFTNGLQLIPSDANDPDTVAPPVHGADVVMKGTIEIPMEQKIPGTHHAIPWFDYVNQVSSDLKIVYASETEIPSTSSALGYAMNFHFPNLTFTDVEDFISDAGELMVRISFEAVVGDIVTAENASPDIYHVPFMISMQGVDADDSSAKWCASNRGGNDVPSDLTTPAGTLRTDVP